VPSLSSIRSSELLASASRCRVALVRAAGVERASRSPHQRGDGVLGVFHTRRASNIARLPLTARAGMHFAFQEEEGESLSDDDKEEEDKEEPVNDAEEEEGWVVPDGHLSDDERQGDHDDHQAAAGGADQGAYTPPHDVKVANWMHAWVSGWR
jgi:hypothetical protein